MTDAKKKKADAEATKLGVIILGVIIFGIYGLFAIFDHGSSENPDDYSTCSDLATSPGTDVNSARCVDDNGDVINYKDSEYGKAIIDLANQ